MSDSQKIQTNNGSNSIQPVIGAHLFFGAGPLNWLNSLNKSRIKEDISQIKSEGFTHLFLIIPWAEILFDDQHSAQNILKEVLSEAELQNMGVFLRICYLWESGKTLRSTYQLMNDWPHSEATQGDLREYLRIIRELSSNVHTNIKYFVSWEDLYWPIYRHWEQETLERRKHLANISGFNTFLDLINANDVPREIPPYISEHSILFTSFFDNIIIPRFLNVVKQELGEIGFEYRIDSDHVGYIDESKITPSFYHWSRSQPFCNKKFIYFHQNIGGSDEKELGTRAAINNLDWLLRTTSPMRNFKEELPLIDQFNFIDTTESNWAAISEQGDEINTFLKESISLIGKKSSGVALWGYHDWPKDIMFNGSFNYDLCGWICNDLTLLQCNGFCHFSVGGIISQEVKLELPIDRDWTCKVEIENTQDVVTEFSISLGEQAICHIVPAHFKGCIETLLTPINFLTLSIKCLTGEFNLTNVKLYDRVYSQGGKQSQQVNSVPFDFFLNAVASQQIKTEEMTLATEKTDIKNLLDIDILSKSENPIMALQIDKTVNIEINIKEHIMNISTEADGWDSTPRFYPKIGFPSDFGMPELFVPSIYRLGHFYSPLVDVNQLKDDEIENDITHLGFDLREEKQKQLLSLFEKFAQYISFDKEKTSEDRYFYTNGQFPGLDAAVLFSIMALYKPSKIIEIGCGFSTLVMNECNKSVLGGQVEITCIEPYPRDFLKLLHGIKLVEAVAQDTPIELFLNLKEGDILFIDSSHVSKFGSDVNFIIFKLIPHLKPGVIIHIHDIFIPDDYPIEWIKQGRNWNEQYLVKALLMGNTHLDILWLSHFMGSRFPNLVSSIFHGFPEIGHGGSLWLEVR